LRSNSVLTVYDNEIHKLGGSINTTRENAEALAIARKEMGL
jgi:DNA-binding CsgD family transcriptional regulator